jgi:hypothetical protein
MPPMVAAERQFELLQRAPDHARGAAVADRHRLDRLGHAAPQAVHAHHRALADVGEQRAERDLLRRLTAISMLPPSTSSA